VICHNDFAPYNAVFRDGRLRGVIDFDTISPGARVWDVAHAVYRFVPLSREARRPDCGSLAAQARRLHLFCDAYGLGHADRAVLPAVVARRVAALRDLVLRLAAEGDAAGLRRLADGDADEYDDDVAYVVGARAILDGAL
jgi:Ser/Thr protein kinase RdoA (MazF antagonist)